MAPSIVQYLICPYSNEELKLISLKKNIDSNGVEDIEYGVLKTNEGIVYPIVRGVPRLFEGALYIFKDFCQQWKKELNDLNLLNDKSLAPPGEFFMNYIYPTMKRFEVEWEKHSLEDKTWNLNQDERIEKYVDYMGLKRESFKDKLFLDAGAGTGQLVCSIAQQLNCDIIGFDIQPSIEKGWLQRKKYAGNNYHRVHIIQANVMHPPFKAKTFDGIHSSGVLHHTPNTQNAFNCLINLVKNKGTLSVWLYRQYNKLYEKYKFQHEMLIPVIPFVSNDFFMLSGRKLRKHTTKMPPRLLYFLVYVYVVYIQLFYKLNALIRRKAHPQSIKERVTSIYDVLAPIYSWYHAQEDVISWFKEAGYEEIRETDFENEFGFNLSGIRKL